MAHVIHNSKTLASFSTWAVRFEFYLVTTPKGFLVTGHSSFMHFHVSVIARSPLVWLVTKLAPTRTVHKLLRQPPLCQMERYTFKTNYNIATMLFWSKIWYCCFQQFWISSFVKNGTLSVSVHVSKHWLWLRFKYIVCHWHWLFSMYEEETWNYWILFRDFRLYKGDVWLLKVPFIVIQLSCSFYICLCAGKSANNWIFSFNYGSI